MTYGIGLSKPISVFVDTHGTVKKGLSDVDLMKLIVEHFDLRPGVIMKDLML